MLLALSGCGSSGTHYVLVDKSLIANDYRQADAIIQKAQDEYGAKSRVLYGMDRGMTLQPASTGRATRRSSRRKMKSTACTREAYAPNLWPS